MALKDAKITFDFEQLDGLMHDKSLDHDFCRHQPLPGESCQPVVAEAVARIRASLAESLDAMFKFGSLKIINVCNNIHIATMAHDANFASTESYMSYFVVVKFYLLIPTHKYRVTVDIEEMPLSDENLMDFDLQQGMTNKKLELLSRLLAERFEINVKKIECMPILRRGRTDMPHYLVSSDDRVLEYDFDELVFHEQSQYQDVKIVHSPSLGNTLLLDNLQNLAEADLPYTLALMDHPKVSYKDKRVLILGGGDGGLLYELLKEQPHMVTMAEIDPVVIKACRDHLKPCGDSLVDLKGPRHEIIIDDCLKILHQSKDSKRKFDVIFNDLTDIPVGEPGAQFEPHATQRDNPWHFIEAITNLSLDCLNDDGMLMTHTTGTGNKEALAKYEEFLDNLVVPVSYKSRDQYVPSFKELWVFYTIRKQNRNTKQAGDYGCHS